tara:strand:- start:6206 stop:6394 length:189 start_codon:yes stop_codon:yes gene_type:complete
MEFEKLRNKYLKKYPNSEDPINYTYQFGFDFVTDFLKNANGREIAYQDDPLGADDNGSLIYI